jgi:hypothetical protein
MTFHILTAVNMMVLSWVLVPCGFVGRFQRCGENGGNMFLRNVGIEQRNHMASKPNKTSASNTDKSQTLSHYSQRMVLGKLFIEEIFL